jgi:hypothetical protein
MGSSGSGGGGGSSSEVTVHRKNKAKEGMEVLAVWCWRYGGVEERALYGMTSLLGKVRSPFGVLSTHTHAHAHTARPH